MSCKDCPIGHGCPVDGLDAPILCTNGTYQNETKQDQCLVCPAGYMCISIDVAPTVCPTGLYSIAGVMYCAECPSGHRYIYVVILELIILLWLILCFILN